MNSKDNLFEIELEYSPSINFSFQQNKIPFLHRLLLKNNQNTDCNNLHLKISFIPKFADDIELNIGKIEANSSLTIDLTLERYKAHFDINYLSNLDECFQGEIKLSLCSKNTENNLDLKKHCDISLFPKDEWTGISTLPELICSFILPNSKEVASILKRSAQILYKTTGNSAINGYQGLSKERVFQIVSAIFDSIKELSVHYCEPQKSFELNGQKIRFPEVIVKDKLATCLDFSLLFSAAMEQAGLKPLLILIQGHSFVGCWLKSDSFDEAAISDLQKIRKFTDLDDLFLFETTVATFANNSDLYNAKNIINLKKIEDENSFRYLIDIDVARKSGINPLPIISNGEGFISVEDLKSPNLELSDRKLEFEEDITEDNSVNEISKLDLWKHELLDLTKRNKLLNFKDTNKSIELHCVDLVGFENNLSRNTKFKILPHNNILEGTDIRKLQNEDIDNFINSEINSKRLRSPLNNNLLNTKLINLYRAVKSDLEDSGANTLYLGLGMLEWCDVSDITKKYKSPIILVPVSLIRKSLLQGFELQKLDEDPTINVTLLEFIRKDFSKEIRGINPLPEDESGIDVAKVFRIIKQNIRDISGWELKEELWLSQFSFDKYLLWNDLNSDFDRIAENNVVKCIFGKTNPNKNSELYIKENELDDKVSFNELFCPLSYDSSQLNAIISAEKGKNFVLYGPPGTGKSQTISNLIAHSLAKGKRVLFISEKRVALEVVYKRLSSMGLSRFCLELHSNKSGKKDVIEQFKTSLIDSSCDKNSDWDRVSTSLENTRTQLNSYVRALHKIYPNGLSAYKALGYLIKNKKNSEDSSLNLKRFTNTLEHSFSELEDIREICEKLAISLKDIPNELLLNLDFVKHTTWNTIWEEDLFDCIEKLSNISEELESIYIELLKDFNISDDLFSQTSILNTKNFLNFFIKSPLLPKAFLSNQNWKAFKNKVAKFIASGKKRDASKEALSNFDIEKLLSLDFDDLKKSIDLNKTKFLGKLRIYLKLSSIRKAKLEKSFVFKSSMFDELYLNISDFKKNQKNVESFENASEVFEGIYSEDNPNWNKILELLNYSIDLEKHSTPLGLDENSKNSLNEKLSYILHNEYNKIQENQEYFNKIIKLNSLYEEFLNLISEVESLCALDNDNLGLLPNIFKVVKEKDYLLNTYKNDLRNWCYFQALCKKANKMSLKPLVNAIFSTKLKGDNLLEVFEAKYQKLFIDDLFRKNSDLSNFYSSQFENIINKFNKFDEKYAELTKDIIYNKLNLKWLSMNNNQELYKDEFSVINREIAKKMRHKPVRKLLSEIPSIVKSMKPCFLMSPLSVAKYLDLGAEKFDMLIFDEASQIPVWDAIGAMGRANQVIVVGDPKQLPPTSYFKRSSSADDEFDEQLMSIKDLDSILDECVSISSMPKHYLKWHYRSKNEDLIAFSNYNYYENNLLTFPSIHSSEKAVKLNKCNGIYDRGNSCTNKVEAMAIINEIIRRLNSPLSKKSIGVITFNMAQQKLIENLLEEQLKNYPGLEHYLQNDLDEYLFVKNLENIQGDERDVILFSICFGPDASGNITMNFGPLNKDGGERRLNVAITRAKEEVIIFSSLPSEKINLSSTRARGVAHLKSYLEFAERGITALHSALTSATLNDYDSIFEKEVAMFLKSKGYEVHTQIGCSGYRIDLALVSETGKYFLGIECDGATYHSAATARDRDKLRQSILEGLGWKIIRVWSTQWWRNRKSEEINLLEKIELIKKSFDLREQKNNEFEGISSSNNSVDTNIKAEESVYTQNEKINNISDLSDCELEDYTYADFSDMQNICDLYEPTSRKIIREEIKRIVDIESPITKDSLVKAIASEWNYSKVGNIIKEVVSKCIPSDVKVLKTKFGEVYCKADFSEEDYKKIRVPMKTQLRREASKISYFEMKNAIHYFKSQSIDYTEMPREISKLFGYNKKSKDIEKMVNLIINEEKI